jgi:hypothetical protein
MIGINETKLSDLLLFFLFKRVHDIMHTIVPVGTVYKVSLANLFLFPPMFGHDVLLLPHKKHRLSLSPFSGVPTS